MESIKISDSKTKNDYIIYKATYPEKEIKNINWRKECNMQCGFKTLCLSPPKLFLNLVRTLYSNLCSRTLCYGLMYQMVHPQYFRVLQMKHKPYLLLQLYYSPPSDLRYSASTRRLTQVRRRFQFIPFINSVDSSQGHQNMWEHLPHQKNSFWLNIFDWHWLLYLHNQRNFHYRNNQKGILKVLPLK